MKKHYLFFLFLLATVLKLDAQSDCTSSVIICGNTQPFNPSGVGSKLEQLACGGIEHNSVWLAFQAKANGKLNFVIRPFTLAGLPAAVDVDWSLYKLAGAPGVSSCDTKTQLSCNFSGLATVFGIPGATGMGTPPFAASQFNPGIDVVNGTWYLLMIDQFSNTTPILLSVQFTGNPESPALNSTPGIFDNRPDFTINTTNGCSGIYSFTNGSSATAGIASYSWDFGDGSSSTSANPSHTYITGGTYYVTLSVTDNNGCRSDIRKQVIFNNTPPTVNTGGLFVTPSCTDINNGTLTVVTSGATTLGVTGGTPPYTYELVSPSAMIQSSQSSNVFTGLQPGGYTVKVTDACGKSATGTATVAQTATNTSIGLGIQNTQAACGASATGTATIFANGTVPPYTMALVNSSPVTTGAITAVQRDPVTATYYVTFTNLLPGTYTVEAVDACGKARRATFSVVASTLPVANAVMSPSCAGTATGTITVTATAATGLSGNGTPGTFQYALIAPSAVERPFQSSSVFENLFPGAYTVAVRDACGNTGTSSVNITTAVAPSFGTSFSSISCPNGSTGTIEVQNGTAGGGSPYLFELTAPSPVTRAAQNSNLFSSLPPGTYTVRLTDVCGTQATTNVTVNAATAPTFTTAVTASCSSPASGTVTVTPAATSIAPYSFELIGPGAAIRPVQGSNIANTTNSIFTALNQGTYTVRMTDGCGVPVTNTVTVNAPTALSFPAGTTTVPSCSAGSTGQITVAAPSTGLAAYKYELIAPSPVTKSPQYSRIFNNLPAGNYTIRITDSCGTQVDNSATPVTIAAAAAPALTVTNTSSCAANSGTITCLATNTNQGGGTYLFSLIAPSALTKPNQTSPIFTALPAGAYTVQITDQCGNTGTTTTTIAAAGAFTPLVGGSIVSCNGSSYNGQLIVTTPQNYTTGGPIPPGSGGGPYTYALYDLTNTTLLAGPQSSNIFTVVAPVVGTPTHTVRVTDACGNTSTATATINAPTALTAATISATIASCASANTGIIRVTTVSNGGLSPYTYTLIDAITSAVVAGPQTSIVFNGVPANATGYLVRSTDACGNTVTSAVPLLFSAAVVPTATVTTIASCGSSSTGSITVTPGTGVTLAGGTFSYALYDLTNTTVVRATQASPVFSNLGSGTYTVRITDRCGSTGTVAAIIASGVAAPTSAGVATGTCPGGSSGVITASSTGGSLPVTYTLVDQVSTSVVAGPQAGNIFTGLAAGTYYVAVTDACGSVTNSSNIVLSNLVTTPTITTTTALDCGGTAIIGAYGAGGNGGPYTYALCSGAGCSTFSGYSSSSTFTINTSGTYRVSVQDRCGNSTSSADIVISIPVKPVMTGVTKTNACGTTTIIPSFTGVPNTAFYSIDGANFSSTLPSVQPGCHTIRVADNNAGAFGCPSDPISFSVYQTPVLLTPGAAQVNCTNGNVIATINAVSGNTGCAADGVSFGVKLTGCTGCTLGADPIGTIKTAPATFNLVGATAAGFAPVIKNGSTEICAGSDMNLNFAATYCFGGALPIGIEYFRGAKQGNSHLFDWKVNCSNSGSTTMVLERSSDRNIFSSIYGITITALRCQQPFAYADNTPLPGINYYRLKVTDADGKVSYSNIVALIQASKGLELISITPNLVKDGNCRLNITAAENQQLDIQIMDLAGRLVSRQQVDLKTGFSTINLKVNNLASGTYQLFGITADGMRTRTLPFVKQ